MLAVVNHEPRAHNGGRQPVVPGECGPQVIEERPYLPEDGLLLIKVDVLKDFFSIGLHVYFEYRVSHCGGMGVGRKIMSAVAVVEAMVSPAVAVTPTPAPLFTLVCPPDGN